MPIPGRWTMLMVLFVARTAMGYQFQSVPSAGLLLVDALGIDFAQFGALLGLYMLPGVLLAIPGGVLGERFGGKRIVLIGLALMALGGWSMDSRFVALVFAGRLVSGIGAVFLNVLMTKMVASWFAGRETVTAMAVFISSWPLGIALGLVSFPVVAAAYGWGAIMTCTALAALLSGVLIAVLYREPTPESSVGPATPDLSGPALLSRREWVLVSLVGFIWGAYNVAYIVFVTFLPEQFTASGYTLADASRLVSLLGWVVIPSVPLFGYLAERLRSPNLLMAAGFGMVALCAALLPFSTRPETCFVCIVLFIGLPAGLIMTLPGQALRAENLGTGMGVFYTWHYAALAALPGLAGILRDLFGVSAPILFAGALMLLAAQSLATFRVAHARL